MAAPPTLSIVQPPPCGLHVRQCRHGVCGGWRAEVGEKESSASSLLASREGELTCASSELAQA